MPHFSSPNRQDQAPRLAGSEHAEVTVSDTNNVVGVVAVQAHPDLCRNCQACQLGCSLYHEGQCHLGLARLQVRKDMARYTFDIRICRHCAEPECVKACPADALRLDGRGVAIIDDEECIACGNCAEACPYGAIFFDEGTGHYLKCDLCAGRAEGPLCIALCPVGALSLLREPAGGES
jgi:carbon-monoxide dehydrogenase iron sulfur subunit